jgi:hypothetical protein
VARHGRAEPLGPQRAAARRRQPHHPLGGGARHGARRLRPLRPGNGDDRQALLRRELDRRAGPPRQGAGRTSSVTACIRCSPVRTAR